MEVSQAEIIRDFGQEIARLRAEIERLKAAHRAIEQHHLKEHAACEEATIPRGAVRSS